eukprot:TRINITY_DN37751_c0_g1_i1.p1 TRINITY_DN37751_c0_g1~~TRINITY_DN37751_c0_g1_i1.p1  ORF type:complete len:229 (+),score=54.33 TRINITY_DN37751_c0_g1_i1:37-723(+)
MTDEEQTVKEEVEVKTEIKAEDDTKAEEYPPNPTLYIRNLSEKVGKEELKKSLWQMFNQFGEIIDIYCRPKVLKCKGQAWVCFRDVTSSKAALGAMQGWSFYNQKMEISYAKTRSDAVAKLDGTYVERKSKAKRKSEATGTVKRAKEERRHGGEPNKKLLVENCPEGHSLDSYFHHFPGFKTVNPSQKGIAFVDFQDVSSAAQALSGLQDLVINGKRLKISFATKTMG